MISGDLTPLPEGPQRVRRLLSQPQILPFAGVSLNRRRRIPTYTVSSAHLCLCPTQSHEPAARGTVAGGSREEDLDSEQRVLSVRASFSLPCQRSLAREGTGAGPFTVCCPWCTQQSLSEPLPIRGAWILAQQRRSQDSRPFAIPQPHPRLLQWSKPSPIPAWPELVSIRRVRGDEVDTPKKPRV